MDPSTKLSVLDGLTACRSLRAAAMTRGPQKLWSARVQRSVPIPSGEAQWKVVGEVAPAAPASDFVPFDLFDLARDPFK